jgi:hypothetical protein
MNGILINSLSCHGFFLQDTGTLEIFWLEIAPLPLTIPAHGRQRQEEQRYFRNGKSGTSVFFIFKITKINSSNR